MDEQKSIQLWEKHYNWCKEQLAKLERGEDIGGPSIQCLAIGPKNSLIKEVNTAVDRLEGLGVTGFERLELESLKNESAQ